MELLKSNYNIFATSLFIIFILVAHILATHNYDLSKNTISDLGSQGYERKLIIQFGFILFGLTLTTGIILNGLKRILLDSCLVKQ